MNAYHILIDRPTGFLTQLNDNIACSVHCFRGFTQGKHKVRMRIPICSLYYCHLVTKLLDSNVECFCSIVLNVQVTNVDNNKLIARRDLVCVGECDQVSFPRTRLTWIDLDCLVLIPAKNPKLVWIETHFCDKTRQE